MFVNSAARGAVWGVLTWIVQKIFEGALPEIGKALSGMILRGGGGVAVAWLLERAWLWWRD